MSFFSKSPSAKSVLFVCTANITRSPAAEALFRQMVSKISEGWVVSSAGVSAMNGAAPHLNIAYVMRENGIPIYKHKSKPVTRKLLKKFQWVVVMENKHREAILKLDPSMEGRIFIFRELSTDLSNEEADMPDPTGKEGEDYLGLIQTLQTEMPLVVRALQQKAEDIAWQKEKRK